MVMMMMMIYYCLRSERGGGVLCKKYNEVFYLEKNTLSSYLFIIDLELKIIIIRY